MFNRNNLVKRWCPGPDQGDNVDLEHLREAANGPQGEQIQFASNRPVRSAGSFTET